MKWNMKNSTKKKLCNVLFLLPACIVFFVFVLIPFLEGIPLSLYEWNGYSDTKTFVGISNYVSIVKDGNLLEAVGNTFEFTVYYLLGCNVLGLMLALLMQKTTRLNSVLRTIFFIPFVLSMILASFMFSYIYSDVFYGIFGIKSFLGNMDAVNPAIAAIAVWKDSGYCMIIYIASLTMVPGEYYEAAKIEGCGRIQSFFRITMPLIVPAFTANLTLILAWGMQAFDYQMAATGGGPGHASETIGMYIYKNIFVYHNAGYGQAAGVLLTAGLAFLTMALTGVLRRKEVEL